jgi:hypothetical protein
MDEKTLMTIRLILEAIKLINKLSEEATEEQIKQLRTEIDEAVKTWQ